MGSRKARFSSTVRVAIANSLAELVELQRRRNQVALLAKGDSSKLGDDRLALASRALAEAEAAAAKNKIEDPMLYFVAARVAELAGVFDSDLQPIYDSR